VLYGREDSLSVGFVEAEVETTDAILMFSLGNNNKNPLNLRDVFIFSNSIYSQDSCRRMESSLPNVKKQGPLLRFVSK
jgi:hypothetical protein